MALRTRRGGSNNGLDAWPGYVDALSTLLMVVMFVLLVFVLAQAFQSVVLTQRNDELSTTNKALTFERERSLSLSGSVARLNQNMAAGDAARTALLAQMRDLNAQTAARMAERDQLAALLREVELAAAAAATMNRALTARVEAAAQTNAQLTTDLTAQTRRAEETARTSTRLTADLAARTADLGVQTRRVEAEAQANTRLAADLGARTTDLGVQTRRVEEAAQANTRLTADLAARTGDVAEQTQRAEAVTQASARLAAELAARTVDIERMRQETAATEARMREMREQMAALDRTVKADKAVIDAKLSDLARLMEQITALTALRDTLEQQARAAVQRQRVTEARLGDEKKLSESSQARMALLTQQVEQLRAELATSDRQRVDEKVRAVGLTDQLNLALATQVEELRKYRSDFFGKLRVVLAERPGVTVVGDRFVFQSEVLFGVSSAELTAAGVAGMADLAATFRKIIEEIPPDVNWVLRVDGHTDSVPVNTARFRSNWELSAARAITVVKFLSTQGIPARHLAATGFGENQPVDSRDTAEAHARNRRIEIRLTDR